MSKSKKAEKVVGEKSETKLEAGASNRGAIGRACRKLLVEQGERGEGLSYEEILSRVRAEFPQAKTTVDCLRWYAADLRKDGEFVPLRPRVAAEGPAEPQQAQA